jgi:NADH:ubiquinone oxidoreductase subunit 2 (subunit N)
MYMEKGPAEKVRVQPMLGAAISVAVIMVVAIGIYPDAVVTACRHAGETFSGLVSGWP